MAAQKNYSYVTFLTNNGYVRGVLLLKESLRRVHTKYPLLCLVTDDVEPVILDVLKKAGIQYRHIPTIEMPQHILEHNKALNERQTNIWRNVFTKLQIFSLTEFDKVILLDADLMINKNLDHCFEMPHMTAALDGEYNNIWPLWPHFNTGFLVIKPDKEEYEKILDFGLHLDPKKYILFNGEEQVISDQEILNFYYADWPDKPELHLNKYYNVFPLYVPGINIKDILKNSYFFHFVGTKPWETWNTKYLGLGDQDFSVVSWDVKQNTRCNLCYAIGFTIIDLCYQNNFKDLDWDKLEMQGYFDYYIAKNCLILFLDFKNAKEYIERALKLQPKNLEFLALQKEINKKLEASEVKPLVIEVLKRVYNDAINTGTPTLDLQAILNNITQVDIDTEYSMSVVSRYWHIMKSAVEDYFKKVYKEGLWTEIE